ncbi:MAG: HesA/MoeB/ThiF family protein [Deltaproteobacteria bacterium]|nr:HesA/MoeB/ThiF family protein [Deltaproteobacteria bacterium]
MPEAALADFLRSRAEGDLLPWAAQVEGAARSGAGLAEVELAALRAGLLPARYRRNRSTLTVEDQLRLHLSRVGIVGCGGLGGYLVEELARLGVGTLVLVDPDVFEEHNLNRQLLSTPARLGAAKVEVARDRVAEVNPAATVVAHREALSAANGARLLAGCSAVADGLDSVRVRRELAAVCRGLGVPLVHGAIAGWYGQVAVQLPGADLSPLLRETPGGKGIETALGNPAFTPAVVASLQVAEVAKLLLGRGKALAGRVLHLDLLEMRFEELPLG